MLNINHDLKTDCGHSSKVLRTMNKESYNALKSLKILSQQGYVKETTLDNWVLTEKGKEKAITILNEKGALID
jgi:Mn-dependent DtxR family transcriptional regulator